MELLHFLVHLNNYWVGHIEALKFLYIKNITGAFEFLPFNSWGYKQTFYS